MPEVPVSTSGIFYGVGRADYIIVNPQANTANTYFNVCPDGGLTPETPELPVVTVPGPAPPNGGGGGSGSGIFDQKTSDPNCACMSRYLRISSHLR